jgi:uncharacterized DUF497 family protein
MIDVRSLKWDSWNKAHIARHGVTRDEVYEVCQSKFVVLAGKKGRAAVVGVTKAGRMLTVILDPEPEEGIYYPVTARSADKKERSKYRQEQEKGGEDSDDKAA